MVNVRPNDLASVVVDEKDFTVTLHYKFTEKINIFTPNMPGNEGREDLKYFWDQGYKRLIFAYDRVYAERPDGKWDCVNVSDKSIRDTVNNPFDHGSFLVYFIPDGVIPKNARVVHKNREGRETV
jgi:hypothetical protein